MTDSHSGPATSYAAGLQRLAMYAAYVARERLVDLYNDLELPISSTADADRLRAQAAIDADLARTLAGLVERIVVMQERIDEWRETAISGSMTMREPLTLLELIARGYRAAPEGERNG